MAAPRFPRNNFVPVYPVPDHTFPVIQNFCLTMQPLLTDAMAADANVQRHSTRSLLEILFWFANGIFTPSVAIANLPPGPVTQAVHNAEIEINNLVQQVNAINVLFPQPNNGSATAPGEAPLELALQTIVENGNHTFANAWQLLQQHPVVVAVPNGMPLVAMLASGPPGGANVTNVVSTNDSDFGRFNRLETWLRQARNNAMNLPPYINDTNTRKNLVNANIAALQAAWNAAAPGNEDADVVAAWGLVAMPPGLAHSLTRPNVNHAMAFSPRWQGPTNGWLPRCRRCRVVYRYQMGDAANAIAEPVLYNMGVYPTGTSCAEVSTYQKCARYGI